MVLIIFISFWGLIYEQSRVQLYCVSFAEKNPSNCSWTWQIKIPEKAVQFILFSSGSKCQTELLTDVSLSQKAKAVGRPIRNKTLSRTGSAILETGKERLKLYSVRVKTRSHNMWKKRVASKSKLCAEVLKNSE